jgi:hypothetical protein
VKQVGRREGIGEALAQAAGDVLALSDARDALFRNRCFGGGIGCTGLPAGDSVFHRGCERLVFFDRGLVHVLKACPKSFVGFGVLKLQAALLLRVRGFAPLRLTVV